MRLLRVLGTLVLLALALVGCSLDGGDSDSGGGGGGGGEQAEAPALDGGQQRAPGDGADGEAADDGREVITTGSMTLVVDDVTGALEEATRIVEAAGGRVDERSQQAAAGSAGPRAWLTVRVPAADLTTTLEELQTLGELETLQTRSQDVTRQTQDLDARITALETSVDRLLSLMADAESSEALITAEEALSERQAELESLRSQRAYLQDQVELSTIRIDLVPRADAQLEPGGFLGGIEQGWNALVAAASGLLVALGVLLPWLVVLGVPAALLVWALRRRRTSGGRDRARAGSPGRPEAPAEG